MKNTLIALVFLLVLFSIQGFANENWKAKWVSFPNLEDNSYSVLHFRNSFPLTNVPENFDLKISADIRYKMYVNGKYVGQGPANNDLKHYLYDELDISDYLKNGENIIAITVFSLGKYNPLRYESSGAKLIVQGSGKEADRLINTGTANWKVHKNIAYTPTVRGEDFDIISYYAMGGGEKVDASCYPWGFENPGFDDKGWEKALDILEGQKYGDHLAYGGADLSLQPRSIPSMDESPETRLVLRDVKGMAVKTIEENWRKEQPLAIPANTEVTFLLDQSYLTKGHPFFTFSGGKQAVVEVSYAETLFISGKTQGHRDEIEGKKFVGLKDIYLLDGGKNREFSTLIPRIWRYVQVKIKTNSEPLTWDTYSATKFIYPFTENAVFDSGLPLHKNIWKVGWRTAKLCADETYMDCPYYEQLQYVGDTRIQALISLYVSGDGRLMKNAIDQFGNSITDEGITQSRYPSSSLQYIPPYSLFWINMIHDYHMHQNDDEFTKSHLYKIASVLYWFENKLQDDHLLGPMPWWSYVDVVETWKKSSPPGSWDGGSIVLTLQYVYALQEAIALFDYHKKDSLSEYFTELKNTIQKAVIEKGYSKEKSMFADTPEKKEFSQHANILAILTDTAPLEQQNTLFKTITSDPNIATTNLYFTFYLTRAAQKSGNGSYFLSNLSAWENMLKKGLTTFAESIQNTRSDCHAWSASPNYEFLNTVCGIQPASPHFDEIVIEPNPGNLGNITGKMPHPKGEIVVQYTFKNNQVSGEITIPEGTKGNFKWKGKQMTLNPGKNVIRL